MLGCNRGSHPRARHRFSSRKKSYMLVLAPGAKCLALCFLPCSYSFKSASARRLGPLLGQWSTSHRARHAGCRCIHRSSTAEDAGPERDAADSIKAEHVHGSSVRLWVLRTSHNTKSGSSWSSERRDDWSSIGKTAPANLAALSSTHVRDPWRRPALWWSALGNLLLPRSPDGQVAIPAYGMPRC